MKDFLGGTCVFLQGKCGCTGVDLVAIGYKYNTKKVLQFVTTLGADSTEKGTIYKAKYNDRFGNVCYQDVPCLAVISTHFLYSNAVNVNNQLC